MSTPHQSGAVRTGRSPGSPQNREAILTSARRQFGERGFQATTIRQIAAGAGVDMALVYHYFDSKDQLLLEALKSVGTFELAKVLDGDLDSIGERLLRGTLAVYEDGSDVLLGLLRSASTHEGAAKTVRNVFASGGVMQLLHALNQPQAELRAALIASTVVGMATIRSIVRIEPLAGAGLEALIAWYAPTIQKYLVEPLPEPLPGDGS